MNMRQNAVRPASPLQGVNDPGEAFKNPAAAEFLRVLIRAMTAALEKCAMRDRPQTAVLLQSPAGKVYSVTVADDGTLSATYVQG